VDQRLSVPKSAIICVESPICVTGGSPVTDYGLLPAPDRPVVAEPDNAAETARLRADSNGPFCPAVE